MKKNNIRLLSLVLALCMMFSVLTACDNAEQQTPAEQTHVDYVGQLKLDMDSTATLKQEVSWGPRSHIDGDTSHFEVPKSFNQSGIVKARYLAVDTPESTGHIEEWGKAASRYTQEKLSAAHSIVIESDDASWNYDGNGRYLVWVWYQPEAGADYRNLNIELLQNGLGASSKAAENRYGTIAVAAIAQATKEKLYMFNKELKDPEFPYGEAVSVTLKELRTNVKAYEGQRVSVEGVVTYNSDYTVYIESYDAEDNMYYGMQVFYGYDSQLITVLEKGCLVRVVGVVNEFYGTYQITDLKYNRMRPEDPANTAKLSTDNAVAYMEVAPEVFAGQKTIMVGEEEKTVAYAELAVSTSISMKNMKIIDTYTTKNQESDDYGAMTLTCDVGGEIIDVRTEVFKNADGTLMNTKDDYPVGTIIDVKGIVDHYEGSYQIRVMSPADVTIH